MKNSHFVFYLVSLLFLASAAVIYFTYQYDPDSNQYFLDKSNSSCIDCHDLMDGLSPLHSQLECISCHKGDNSVADKDSAHYDMIRVPGNLADAAETCGICHPDAVNHITNSMMTTNSGIIAVDKYIFGEFDSPNQVTSVTEVDNSMADQHLRALCLRCHLGSDKKIYGEIDQLSRGGGCNACHLNYTEAASSQLIKYFETGELPSLHPSVDLNISNEHCFGCHSRSGRISLHYEGYHETLMKSDQLSDMEGFQKLQDDRIIEYVKEDVHHERGLACIDCHGYDDVMGDGNTYVHEEDAVKISCEDCHSDKLKSINFDKLGLREQRIIKMREYTHSEKPILIGARDSTVITNGYIDQQGNGKLITKLGGKEFDLRAPSSSCSREFGHNSLTCSSCHTQWSPQCIGCHVSYEADADGYDLLEKKPMKGSWVEYAGGFLYGPPSLGVRETENGTSIEPAIPGMIMTLDKASYQPHAMPKDTSFYRLFAPASPHTIGEEGRTCTSCHTNPQALGFGRGQLDFRELEGSWQWQFTSEYELLEDGLPADAWTGFLQESKSLNSTRTNFRPFTIEEQKRVLRVGACFTCHENNSPEMKNSLKMSFNSYLGSISNQCIVLNE